MTNAAVDYCPRSVAAAGPQAMPAAEFTCNACAEAFASAAEQRAHCKLERHVYNTKRRLAGLKPISQEAWERKLKESRAAGGPSKGTDHLKAGKAPRKGSSSTIGGAEAESGASSPKFQPAPRPEEESPFTPRRCLFDRRMFGSVDECLAHMWKNYSFFVPDREYCTDLEGLLRFLWKKQTEPPHACLFCNRRFPDTASARRHMLDKGHARIGTEARSRRGLPDESGTAELEAELEEFYDFSSSTREITERIKDPVQKVGALLRFFDADRDDRLLYPELKALWEAVQGAELTEEKYFWACSKTEVDPNDGIDSEALALLYDGGLADLDAHFGILQDLLAQKSSASRKSRNARLRAEREDREGKGEDREEDNDEEDEEDDKNEEESDVEGDEDDDGDSSGTEMVECEDEDEFEEVMRILGLQPVTLMDNGDLRLPNGNVAVNRDVAHIWKQRGVRLSQQLATLPEGAGGLLGRGARTPLMLSGREGTGVTAALMSRREQAKEGKRVIAFLREKNKREMKLGMQQNILQTKTPKKFRTVVGDMSGGR